MPLKKLLLKPGVNRENTRYTTEGGWYDCDKIRFRQGTPEKVGGWERLSADVYQGVCRSLWNWVTLGGDNLIGVGTNLKFYIYQGGFYNDITPLRDTEALTNPFATTSGSALVTVTDAAGGYTDGDFVTFTPTSAVGGILLAGEYEITTTSASTYTIIVQSETTITTANPAVFTAQFQLANNIAVTLSTTGTLPTPFTAGTTYYVVNTSGYTFQLATTVGGTALGTIGSGQSGVHTVTALANATASGGGATSAAYQLNVGPAVVLPLTGWGAGPWGSGAWGIGSASVDSLRLWSQSNYGENLVFCPRGEGLYYWDASSGVGTRAVNVTSLAGASDVPTLVNMVLVSDISRFVLAFGCTDLSSIVLDPMLIRWSDQEDIAQWTPSAENQAGGLRLSQGSQIVAVAQSRQEILTWTDSALYSLQYQGPPFVWGAQLVGDNISIASQNAATVASGVAYWMGVDKFYKYDGRTQTLRCDLRQYIFSDLNQSQLQQVCCGTNEGFNEVWWFYPSADSMENDRYAVYNYGEDIWYYGNLGRTAWLDSALRTGPIAATYDQNIVLHETGNDDDTTGTPVPIEAYITSSEFDLDDGHNFVFIWRVLPDITFRGSNASAPQVTMTLLPLQNSGSGYNAPPSVGGVNTASVARSAVLPVEQFTGQIFTRVRGRQMAMKISSTALGVAWQLGSPRLDMRADGRR